MRKTIYKILLAVNILFAVSLLIAYMAVHISPGDFAIPAFFGLAYPYILLINIILVIAWTALLKWEALISVVIIAAGFTHFSNFIILIKPTVNKTDTFKLLSYNVRLFNHFEGKNYPNSERKIIEFLNSQQPDIICLQELYISGNPNQKEASFRKDLSGKYFSHFKVFGNGKESYFGIATFSKYPIIKKGAIVHPGSSSLTIYTDVLIKSDTFRIYNNYLQSFKLRRMENSFISEITNSDDKENKDEVKTISVSLKNGFKRRALQAQEVKDNIDRSPYPVIVAGDFNDTPVSYSYRKIRNKLNDSFISSGYGAGFTYKGNYPPNRIDYILYDNSLKSACFEIIKIRYSDHYPIIAYFRKKN